MSAGIYYPLEPNTKTIS